MGYYDPYPLVSLERPLVLLGFAGAELPKTGYFLTALTGLPFSDLARVIEHRAGQSLLALQRAGAEKRWAQLEEELFDAALRETPPRLIVFGEARPLSQKSLRLMRSRARSIYLRRPREQLLLNIQRGLQEQPDRFPSMVDAPPRSLAELVPLLEARESLYEQADELLDAGVMSPLETAQTIARRLGWSSGEPH